MVENEGNQVLSAVKNAVGLIIDAEAIVPMGDESGRCRIRPDRLVSDGGTRVQRNNFMAVCCQSGKGAIGSGVLLKVRLESGDTVLAMATAAHCCPPDPCWRKRTRFVAGLGKVDEPFACRQVLELGDILHFENVGERDLAIVRMEQCFPYDTVKFTSDSVRVSAEERVYVVGYEGGSGIGVYEGSVKNLIPEAGRPLRGFNVETVSTLRAPSGSPVFRWSNGPELLGVVQGPKEVHPLGLDEKMARLQNALRELADAGADATLCDNFFNGVMAALTRSEPLLMLAGSSTQIGGWVGTQPNVGGADVADAQSGPGVVNVVLLGGPASAGYHQQQA